MAKHQRHMKGSQVLSQQGRGVSFEQQESIDDSLLPEASELAKLKELDEGVVQWVKERTAKEQDARLDFNDRRMGLLERSQKMAFSVDIIAILAALSVTMGGMYFSYLLIQEKQIITGTIFAGASILLSANSFLNFRKKVSQQGEGRKPQ